MRMTVFLFLFLPLCSLAQLMDDFSDGEFSANPAWSGTDSCFIVNKNQQLQSAGTVGGEAYLSVRTSINRDSVSYDVVEWRFWLRENFSPSANNIGEVWLMADSANLTKATTGYFLRFGAAGSQDAVELYRKDSNGSFLVCKGPDASIASAFKMAVKVNRDLEGHWMIMTDRNNEGNYVVEAEGIDNTYPIGEYFGFYIKYTGSNAKKFYFDDVYVGPKILDLTPPELLAVTLDGTNRLLLSFNESIDTTALAPSHYRLEPQLGHPDSVWFADSPSKLLLSFPSPLPENLNLRLVIHGLADFSGNVMGETTWEWCVYVPHENDIVINEIMADPTPVVGLPEWEYVELYNTTEFSIDMTGWLLTIGTSEKVFPAARLGPNRYLILCKDDAVGELSSWGSTCGFSSFSIANAGVAIRLLSPSEDLISEVVFDETWYHDAEKKLGGWSLEQIDPYNPCAGTFNWSASTASLGGTPGVENSINAPNAFQPKLERISMLGEDMVLLWFDQQMDRASLSDPSHYRVTELDLHPATVVCNPLDATSVRLEFDVTFEEGIIYTLLVTDVMNCSGNLIEDHAELHFGIPFTIEESDIVINEILFDPISPGVDYVELYNPSDKAFDLMELKLGVIKASFPDPPDTTLYEIETESRLFLPHHYLLLSTDGVTVTQQYGCELNEYVNMRSFPTYSNAGGIALLMSRHGVVVDQMEFSPSMHYPLLKETKGVALERVSLELPSSQPDNWHSAAESVHFGTPGYVNSMVADRVVESDGAVTITPAVFSPDGDGFDDHCIVSYAFDETGSTVNVYVFNVDGQLVRHLVRGELVGKEGGVVWNGLDRHGRRVPLGVYVMVTEVFTMEGEVRRYRNAVAVASR